MKIFKKEFCGVEFEVPVENFEFPCNDLKDFPTSCGAGKFGDAITPDELVGCSISPACFIHDVAWDVAEKTRKDFRTANQMFLHNMLAIINADEDQTAALVTLRRGLAIGYYEAVSTAGLAIFLGEHLTA